MGQEKKKAIIEKVAKKEANALKNVKFSIHNKPKKETKFGDWEITKSGDLRNVKNGYFIEKSRLINPDWILHISGKNWVNMNDFISAYFQALENISVTELKITINYKL